MSARAVQLAARQGNAAAAADALRQVCVSPSPDPWAVKAAVKAMTDARWGQLARKILEELLPGEQTNLEVGREWARLCTAQKRWGDCGRKLAELAGRSRVGAEAAVVYIEALAKAGQRLRLRWFLWRNQDWLRKNTRCWGSVGYVLNHLHWFKYLLRWLADWRQRNDLEPWILKNLVEGLRRVGRDAEAAEAGRRALALPPDQSHAGHRLWLAADACCQGRIDAARELLQQVEGTNFRPEDKFLRLSALAVVTMASARAEERPLVFRAERKRLDQAQAQYPGGVRDPGAAAFLSAMPADHRAVPRRLGGKALVLVFLAARGIGTATVAAQRSSPVRFKPTSCGRRHSRAKSRFACRRKATRPSLPPRRSSRA